MRTEGKLALRFIFYGSMMVMLAPVLRGKVAGMQFSNAFKQRANFTLFRVEWGGSF